MVAVVPNESETIVAGSHRIGKAHIVGPYVRAVEERRILSAYGPGDEGQVPTAVLGHPGGDVGIWVIRRTIGKSHGVRHRLSGSHLGRNDLVRLGARGSGIRGD